MQHGCELHSMNQYTRPFYDTYIQKSIVSLTYPSFNNARCHRITHASCLATTRDPPNRSPIKHDHWIQNPGYNAVLQAQTSDSGQASRSETAPAAETSHCPVDSGEEPRAGCFRSFVNRSGRQCPPRQNRCCHARGCVAKMPQAWRDLPACAECPR